MSTPRLPPAIVVGAHYDAFLQRAMARFFERATLETESVPSPSSDGRLAIEPTDDPGALAVRWFGSRHVLRVPGQRPFTDHEVRFARAIGDVLAARYRAILHPAQMVGRDGLFRGAIEDRYVGAFFDPAVYAPTGDESSVDRVADAIEILRVAALSSYENQAISTGVLLLEGDSDPHGGGFASGERLRPRYTGALSAIKSFFRLADGTHTVFLVARDGRVLDIVDIEEWAWRTDDEPRRATPLARVYEAHARSTAGSRRVCVVLSPSHEIKVFAEGIEVFAFRHADWHLLDLEAKYALWQGAVGDPALAERLFRTALDLAEDREGALFVVLRRPLASLSELVLDYDRMDMALVDEAPDPDRPSRRHLLHLFAGRTATELAPSVLSAMARLDGAVVTDRQGQLLAVGAILRHPSTEQDAYGVSEGARTTAAATASRFGPVLKVSEDGMISFYDGGLVWNI